MSKRTLAIAAAVLFSTWSAGVAAPTTDTTSAAGAQVSSQGPGDYTTYAAYNNTYNKGRRYYPGDNSTDRYEQA